MSVYVITGGTMVHVSPHFALCAPAFGEVGAEIANRIEGARLVRTSMASGGVPLDAERALFAAAGLDRLETNADLAKLLDFLIADRSLRCIVLAAAVCDWEPTALQLGDEVVRHFGKSAPRLRTALGDASLHLTPTDKLVARVRRQRPDVTLVAFKATAGLEPRETRRRGEQLLERAGASVVLANDVQRGTNIVIADAGESYVTHARHAALDVLAQIVLERLTVDRANS